MSNEIPADLAAKLAADQKNAPEFMIQRLYVKDASLESPNAPAIYQENLQPAVTLNINTAINKISTDQYEVVLTGTITAAAEQRTVFLIEVQQAGLFIIKNIPEANMPVVLNVTCPTVLFPYLREIVSTLTAHGGFPPFYLAPINFEALYVANLQKQQGTPETKDEATSH